jgi:hypothetical protein
LVAVARFVAALFLAAFFFAIYMSSQKNYLIDELSIIQHKKKSRRDSILLLINSTCCYLFVCAKCFSGCFINFN